MAEANEEPLGKFASVVQPLAEADSQLRIRVQQSNTHRARSTDISACLIVES